MNNLGAARIFDAPNRFSIREKSRRLGFVPQNRTYFPMYTTWEFTHLRSNTLETQDATKYLVLFKSIVKETK
jgi:hypothetical protein